MTKNILIGVLVVALLGLGFVRFSPLFGATGQTHYQKESFLQGLFFGTTRQANLSSDGSADFTSLAIDTGTAITEHGCATATYNPGSLGTSSVTLAATSTDIALSGAAVGDTCVAAFSRATTSLVSVGCNISGSATATLTLLNMTGLALDLNSGTARVCYTAH